jgi:hypothetical protein
MENEILNTGEVREFYVNVTVHRDKVPYNKTK